MPTPTLDDIVGVYRCCLFNWGLLTTLLPAFLLAGALTVFVPSTAVARFLGPATKKPLAYAVGSASGCLLPTCSCNVVPLFMSIRAAGAGLGPAIAFLYAGPAINPVSLVYGFEVMGWRLGLWRAVAVPVLAVVLGLVMAALFGRGEAGPAPRSPAVADDGSTRGRLPAVLTIGLLVVVLIAANSPLPTWLRVGVAVVLLAALGLVHMLWLDRDDLLDWLAETWKLVRSVFPVLLVSVLVIGLVARTIPAGVLAGLLGKNGAGSVLLAAVFGALMYFPMLTDLMFAKSFVVQGMAAGPAFAVVLTGAGMSLPGLLLVRKVLGLPRTLVYMALLVVLATAGGLAFGAIHGDLDATALLQKVGQPLPDRGEAVDTDGDGSPNRITQPIDLDGDGKVDQRKTWVYDKQGRMLSAEFDSNADGRPDQAYRYEYDTQGRMTRQTFDADGDGRPDRIWTPATGWQDAKQ